jgi:hypothetical protein
MNPCMNFLLTLLFLFFRCECFILNDLGMTKEVSNLIKENNELMETKCVKI